jgi:hypothetical protein
MKDIEQLVKEMLEKYPETRGNDKKLMLHLWVEEGFILNKDQTKIFLRNCSSPETIRRTRQKIQHDGQLLPDGVTVERRKKKAQEMHDKFRHKTFWFDREKEIFVEV